MEDSIHAAICSNMHINQKFHQQLQKIFPNLSKTQDKWAIWENNNYHNFSKNI